MNFRVLAVLLATLLVVGLTTATPIGEYKKLNLSATKVGAGESYDRTEIFVGIPLSEVVYTPTMAPVPMKQDAGSSTIAPRGESSSYSGSMLTTRDGAVYTPQQRAEREISRLIRRLN